MKAGNRKREAIPEEFGSYREAGAFWDSHDTADYPDAFEDAAVEINLNGRRFEIDIDEDVMQLLTSTARRAHARPGRLASILLRRGLQTGSR